MIKQNRSLPSMQNLCLNLEKYIDRLQLHLHNVLQTNLCSLCVEIIAQHGLQSQGAVLKVMQ